MKNYICALFVVLSLLHASAFAQDSQSNPTMRGVMSPTKFVASDFQALGEYKANLIRWQIMRNWGKADTERNLTDYNDWLAGKLNELYLVLLAAEANGLKVVIDLHTPPGGRHSDHSMAMFYEKEYNDRFIQIWHDIATRYNGNPTVWAYDLVNEPTQNKTDPPAGMSSKETQTNAAKVIRAIDSITPIIIAPHSILQYGTLADSYKGFTPVTGISNIWYEVHLYNFDQEFVNHSACYPGPAGGYNWNKDFLRRIISPAKTFQSTIRREDVCWRIQHSSRGLQGHAIFKQLHRYFRRISLGLDVSCFPGGPYLGHGGPGPQDSSFELVCQKLTSEQEDYRRYDDNARRGGKKFPRGFRARKG